MTHRFRLFVIAAGCAAALSSAATRAQIVENPDLSGLWTPFRDRDGGQIRQPRDLPYTERGRELWEAWSTDFDPVTDAPSKFCVHPGMPSSMIGTPTFPMEIFHRPHDVSMMIEAYYQFRKIYMESHDPPEPILSTRMGYSVAHWEDDTTLVVETSHLSPRDKGRLLMSGESRITERIHVEIDEEGRKLLVDDITFVDPLIYTEPITMRGVWVYSPDTPIMEYICSQNIYDEYIAEKRARNAASDER